MANLHYTSAIILLYSSFLGCILPFQNKIDLTPIRPLSTGIVFGVALCHLLPDSTEILDTVQVTEWFTRVTGLHGGGDVYDTLPVSETLMCLGIFIMLVVDQCKFLAVNILPINQFMYETYFHVFFQFAHAITSISLWSYCLEANQLKRND